MKKNVVLLISAAFAAFVAVPVFAAEVSPSAGAGQKPALSPAPVFAAASSARTGAPATPGKVGYVDLTRAAAESKTGKAARAELQAKADQLRAKVEGKQKQLEKQKKAIEAKIATMTPKEREAKAKEFQKKIEDYQKTVRGLEKEMQGMEEKLTGAILNNIEAAATEYGKRNDLLAVVAKKELLYMNPAVETEDITDKIVRMLDERQEKK